MKGVRRESVYHSAAPILPLSRGGTAPRPGGFDFRGRHGEREPPPAKARAGDSPPGSTAPTPEPPPAMPNRTPAQFHSRPALRGLAVALALGALALVPRARSADA